MEAIIKFFRTHKIICIWVICVVVIGVGHCIYPEFVEPLVVANLLMVLVTALMWGSNQESAEVAKEQKEAIQKLSAAFEKQAEATNRQIEIAKRQSEEIVERLRARIILTFEFNGKYWLFIVRNVGPSTATDLKIDIPQQWFDFFENKKDRFQVLREKKSLMSNEEYIIISFKDNQEKEKVENFLQDYLWYEIPIIFMSNGRKYSEKVKPFVDVMSTQRLREYNYPVLIHKMS